MRRLLAIGLLTLAATCQAAGPQDFLQVDSAWNALRQNGDAKGLAPLLADDFMLTHSDGRVQFKADYIAELATRTRVNTGIANEDVKARLYGDTAVVTGTSIQSGISDGKPWSGKFRFTRTWVRRDGNWMIVSSHSSRITP
jgi:ketosteroid isomerase-like protein